MTVYLQNTYTPQSQFQRQLSQYISKSLNWSYFVSTFVELAQFLNPKQAEKCNFSLIALSLITLCHYTITNGTGTSLHYTGVADYSTVLLAADLHIRPTSYKTIFLKIRGFFYTFLLLHLPADPPSFSSTPHVMCN